jgi:hypothetical protein
MLVGHLWVLHPLKSMVVGHLWGLPPHIFMLVGYLMGLHSLKSMVVGHLWGFIHLNLWWWDIYQVFIHLFSILLGHL